MSVTPQYACHNSKRAGGYWVKDGTYVEYGPIGDARQVWAMRWHTDTMSRECQYRKGVPADPRCEGCNVP